MKIVKSYIWFSFWKETTSTETMYKFSLIQLMLIPYYFKNPETLFRSLPLFIPLTIQYMTYEHKDKKTA